MNRQSHAEFWSRYDRVVRPVVEYMVVDELPPEIDVVLTVPAGPKYFRLTASSIVPVL